MVCIHPEKGILGVQVTAGGHGPERLKKIEGLPTSLAWRRAGGKIAIHDWRAIKHGNRRLWDLKITEVRDD